MKRMIVKNTYRTDDDWNASVLVERYPNGRIAVCFYPQGKHPWVVTSEQGLLIVLMDAGIPLDASIYPQSKCGWTKTTKVVFDDTAAETIM